MGINDTLVINNMDSTSFKITGNGGDSVMINGTSVSLEDWEKAVKGEKVILKSSAGKDIVFEGKPKTRKIPNLLFDGELLFGDEIKLFLKVRHDKSNSVSFSNLLFKTTQYR